MSQRDAERMRAARELFARAQRDGVSMEAARDAMARERWEAATGRTAARTGLCGTAAPAIGSDTDGTGHGEIDSTPQRSALWWLNY